MLENGKTESSPRSYDQAENSKIWDPYVVAPESLAMCLLRLRKHKGHQKENRQVVVFFWGEGSLF